MKHVKSHFFCRIVAIALAVSLFTSCAQTAAKFEYKVIPLTDANRNLVGAAQLEAILNKLSSDGWELIQIDIEGHAILKRAK